jgi:hypothetical protein
MILKYTYLLLKQLASTITEVKEFDWYRGQGTANFKGGLKVPVGIYLEIAPFDTRSLGNGIQEGVITFDLHLITNNLADADKRIAPVSGIDHLLIAEKIHKAISGSSGKLSDIPAYVALLGEPEDFTVLNTITRTRVIPDHSNQENMKTTQRFSAYFKDFSDFKPFVTATATLDIQDFEIKL